MNERIFINNDEQLGPFKEALLVAITSPPPKEIDYAVIGKIEYEVLISMPKAEGSIYILSNSFMPNILKIGLTKRDPYQRAKELAGTGTPGRFVVEHAVKVRSLKKAEQVIHVALSEYRIQENREFFQLDIEAAIDLTDSTLSPYRAEGNDTALKKKSSPITEYHESAAREVLELDALCDECDGTYMGWTQAVGEIEDIEALSEKWMGDLIEYQLDIIAPDMERAYWREMTQSDPPDDYGEDRGESS